MGHNDVVSKPRFMITKCLISDTNATTWYLSIGMRLLRA